MILLSGGVPFDDQVFDEAFSLKFGEGCIDLGDQFVIPKTESNAITFIGEDIAHNLQVRSVVIDERHSRGIIRNDSFTCPLARSRKASS